MMMCRDAATLFGPIHLATERGGMDELFFIIPPTAEDLHSTMWIQNPLEIENGEVIPGKQKSIPSNGTRGKAGKEGESGSKNEAGD